MSITYEEALSTLQAMFAEPWTRDTLDAVLRHQRGHMENTVDLILLHGTKDPQILIDQLDAGIDPEQSALQLDEQLARQLAAASLQPSISNRLQPSTNADSSSTPSSNLIGTVTVLPDDFLRIPNYTPPTSSASYSLSDDEALARMLQDELFTEELRRNPDFAHLAGRRPSSATATSHRSIRQGATAGGSAPSLQSLPNPFAGLVGRFGGNQPQPQQQQQRSASQGNLNNANNNNNNIMEKLSEMGEGAKRRLQLMAAQFQAAQTNLRNNNNAASTPTSSLSNDNNNAFASSSERRSLLFDDTDDMELAARKDL